jgi:replicative DNA helicase Mcm
MEEKLREKLNDFLHKKDMRNLIKAAVTKGQKSIVVKFEQILEHDGELAKHLLDYPEDFLQAASQELAEIAGAPLIFRVCSLGRENTVEIRNLRETHLRKFIQIEGIVTRASEVKPEILVAVWKCRWCGHPHEVEQTGEILTKPTQCENPNCTRRDAGSFELDLENSKFRDWQHLSLQERPEQLGRGRMPRRLECIVRDDLTEKAVPGNHVTVTGYLQALPEKTAEGKKTVFKRIFIINYLEVRQKGVEEIDLTEEEIEKIKELSKDPHLREKLIRSIAPSIFGHEQVKEGILLQLMGSDPVELEDGTRIRGDLHILLIGDPGCGKSAILKWVSNVAPRGLYTSAVKSTAAGLTAAAVRDEYTGGWSLEAGALVIADGGIACVDEFEKMDEREGNAILESLEQQTISISKGGIVATLNTRTSLLAAANPKGGRIDPAMTVAEQINIPPVLLSRFDLIFPVRDTPNIQMDEKISSHMIGLHRKTGKTVKPPIPSDLLKKYIVYAKKYIHPQIKTKEVEEKIKEFYLNWRKVASQPGNPLPITPRQLESIIRLAKANARARLSDEVTEEDVACAVRLLEYMLKEVGVDVKTGKVDIDILMTGQPKSQRDKIARLYEIIKELEQQYPTGIPEKEIFEEATKKGLESNFVRSFLEEELSRGMIFEVRRDKEQAYYARVIKV